MGGAAGAGAAAAAERRAVGAAAAVVGRAWLPRGPRHRCGARDAAPAWAPAVVVIRAAARGGRLLVARPHVARLGALALAALGPVVRDAVSCSPSLIPIGATASTAAACSPFALPPALPDGAAPQHHHRSSPTLPPPSLSESSVGPPSSAHACTPRLAPTGGPPLALWAGGSRSDDSGALATGAEPFLDAAVAENSRRASRDLQMQFDACGGGGGSGAGGSAPMVAAALQTNNTHVRESIANQLSLLLDDDDDDDDGLGGAPGATKVRAISEELAELCVSPSRGHAAEVCREVTGANVNVMPSPGRAPAC